MNNQEAADELQYAIDLIKQDGKDWLDERDIPILEAAISALQAQDSPKPKAESVQNVQNEDLISRKAAIDVLGVFTQADALGHTPKQIVEALPSAQPEPQWIPVSEKLPEEDKDVLVTVYFAGLTQKHKTGWNDHIKPSTYVDIASYYGGDWVSASDEYKVARSRHRVIAWMPLPEPYRAERRTDDLQ